jgi:chromosome segregation ATPase
MSSKKSKDHSKMKYILGKKSKGEKSESSLDSEPSGIEHIAPDAVDLLASNASPEQFYIQTLKQEISRLRKKLDDSLDANGEILRAKASHIEDKINLQKALADCETEIQALKSQHITNMQSLRTELNEKADSMRSLDESLRAEKDKFASLESKYSELEKDFHDTKQLVDSYKSIITNCESEIKTVSSHASELSERLKTDEAKIVESNKLIEALKSEKKSQHDTIIQLERKLAEYSEREGYLANDGARMANTISQQNENYEQMNQVIRYYHAPYYSASLI